MGMILLNRETKWDPQTQATPQKIEMEVVMSGEEQQSATGLSDIFPSPKKIGTR